MARRLLSLIALLSAMLLLLAAPAAAAEGVILSPRGEMTDQAEIEVQVNRGLFETVHSVRVELLRNGQRVGQPSAPLACKQGCDQTGSQTYIYGSVIFNPRTGAPFSAGPLPNASYELRAIIEQSGGSPSAQPSPVVLSLPPSAVTALKADLHHRTVALSWTRAPEPDVVGYRVERRTPQGMWEVIDTAAPSADRATDRPGTGTFEYRIVTMRPNGTGTATLEATSGAVSVTIKPEPSPTPSPAPGTGGSDGGGSDGNGNGGEGGTTDGNTGTGREGNGGETGDDGGTQASGQSRSGSSASGSRRSAARAPSLSSLRGNLPSLPSFGGADQPDAEVFYGERQGMGELDYSGVESVREPTEEPEDPEGEIVLEAGGLRSLEALDPERVAIPVAFGLLFTVIGLHLWRWLKIPV